MSNKKIAGKHILGIMLVLAIVGIFFWKINESQKSTQTLNAKKQNELTPKQLTTTKKLLYKIDAGLVLYDAEKQTKLLILGSDITNKLLDFNLARDGKILVYTLKENAFSGDSSVWIKDLQTGNTTQLKEADNIIALNAMIFSDDNKIAYVKRIYDPQSKKISDGEIWVYDMQTANEQKLLGDNTVSLIGQTVPIKDAQGNVCISPEDLASAKIGINKISEDGENIAYWKAALAPDCGGLTQNAYFAKIDGSEFLSQQLLSENIYTQNNLDGENQQQKWTVDDVYWLGEGEFILSNVGQSDASSLFYFDKNQNKKNVIFDNTDPNFNNSGIFSQFSVDDLKVENGKLLLAYELYFDDADENYYQDGKFVGTKYYVGQFTLGEQVTPDKLIAAYPYMSVPQDSSDDISDIKIIDNNNIYYEKWNEQKQNNDSFVFDAAAKKELLLN